jgi:hypothetical protein
MVTMVKNVRFSMAGMCCDQKRHGWNVTWSKPSDSAWLECVMVKNVRFSMATMCCDKKRLNLL